MILATTTKFSNNDLGDVRTKLTLKTFELAKIQGYKVVMVDDASNEVFVEKAKGMGVFVFEQKSSGMGNARREAIQHAKEMIGDDEGAFVVWIEPEKCNIIKHLMSIAAYEPSPQYDLILFNRVSLKSYPREQELTYTYGKLLSEYLLGQNIDLFFGPVAIRKKATDYFLDYKGDYGDRWDSVHIPKLRIIANHISFTQINIEYAHPVEQTSSEMGSLDMFIKRTEQAHELSKAYINEAKKLKLVKI